MEESVQYAKELEAAGATALLIGDGCYDSFYWLYPPTYQKQGLWLDNAKKIKEAVSIPVICPGRLNTPDIANQAIARGFTPRSPLPVLPSLDLHSPLKITTNMTSRKKDESSSFFRIA